ncbi:hypothetical protein A7K50_09180 [Dehalobacter sp. MCB1]|nr:hypothetical protein A7K50_09180 [Dehalobacter sp. MCB1]TCX52069.1 hypothetical protein C1I36_07065 [Dehalobacter sp. 14DCB1]TCX53142.1 hypothetical protein C1I38_08830 [Dehalobacter sp. 12DCB1]
MFAFEDFRLHITGEFQNLALMMAIPMANQAILSTLHIFNHVSHVQLDLLEQILSSGFSVQESGNIV